MSYRVCLAACDLYIPADKALLALAKAIALRGYPGCEGLADVLAAEGFDPEPLPGGGIRVQGLADDELFDEPSADRLLHAISREVADGSFLVLVDEDYAVWRNYFDGGEYVRDCSDWLTRGLGPVIEGADAA